MNLPIYHKDPEAYYGRLEKEGDVKNPGKAEEVHPWEINNESGMLLVHDQHVLKDTSYDPLAGVYKVRRDPHPG